jgi:hypothetical protein
MTNQKKKKRKRKRKRKKRRTKKNERAWDLPDMPFFLLSKHELPDRQINF